MSDIFKSVTDKVFTAALKSLGFKKAGLYYHRRCGSVIQMVNVQKSQNGIDFYINIGLSFDEICVLRSMDILEKPKVSEFQDRGVSARLDQFEDLPYSWNKEEVFNCSEVIDNAVNRLIDVFGELDSIASFAAHVWFEKYQANYDRIFVFYILGKYELALEEINKLCELYRQRGREAGSDVCWWVDKLDLVKLGRS